MQNPLKDILKFFKKPHEKLAVENFSKFRLISILLVIEFPIALVLQKLFQWLFISLGVETSNQLFTLADYLPSPIFLLLAVVGAPLMEEIIFRLPLKQQYNPLYFFAKLSNNFKKGALNNFQAFWQNQYSWIFYGFLVAFTMLHLMNYKIQEMHLYYIPFLVMGLVPIFIVGFLISYIRLKAGFQWGFVFHGLHNLLALTVMLGLFGSPEQKYSKINQDYHLKIQKAGSAFYNQKKLFRGKDSLSIQKYQLPELLKEIKKDHVILKFDEKVKTKSVNLYYKNKVQKAIKSEEIYNGLETAFNLDIKRSEKVAECFSLRKISDVSDSLIFSERKGQYSVVTNIKYQKLSNPSNREIVDLLNAGFQDHYFCPPEQTFYMREFQLKKNSKLNELKSYLKKEKGLTLEPVERSIQFLEVHPD